MEPDQEPSSRPQRIPSAARHHICPYAGLTSSSPTLCDKRLIRRSTHGTPYPQAISISPPPAYLALLPPSSSSTRKADGTTENNNSNNNTDNGGVASGRSPVTTPGATTPVGPLNLNSPFSPPPIIKTTSSLARRRRSTISSSPPSLSPEMKSIPPPPPVPNPSTPLITTARQQFQQNVKHQSPSAATTPDYSASNFWGSGSASGKDSGSSLFVKDTIGLGGSWVGWSTAHRTAASSSSSKMDNNQVPSFDESREVSVELEEAMDEDESSDEDEPPKSAFPHTQSRMATGIGNNYSNHSVDVATENDNARREAEDSLARIAQAMTLLSLGPPIGPSDGQFTSGLHFPNGYSAPQQDGWPPHPTPESLLRESLRQSFEAYKILKELDKRTVFGGAGARQNPVSLPALSRRQSLRIEDEDREISVVDVLRAYDKAAEGVKTAREVMKWAEHWIREEGERTRERLLKG